MSHHEHEHIPNPGGEIPIADRVAIKTGVIWASFIVLGAVIAVSMGLMRAFDLALSQGRPSTNALETEQQLSMIKRMAPLDPNQPAQRRRYEAQQKELLDSYNWINEKEKIARVPIQRAMEITVKQYGKAE